MELEFGQLELRYEKLRRRSARRERQLLTSLSEHGQQLPVVVVRAELTERFVLLDGYKRVRILRRLASDTVQATLWDLEPADALLLERLMHTGEGDSPLEQGWLLVALRTEFGLSFDALAQRFDRSKSWVSRRVALVEQLPEIVQERVRVGILAPYAAMKFLVPLARANPDACIRLVTALARPLSIRQVAALCAAFKAGDEAARARLCAEPELFLRALATAQTREVEPLPTGEVLLRDAGALGGIARRLRRHLRDGQARRLGRSQRCELALAIAQGLEEVQLLSTLSHQELADARPEHPPSHPAPA
jgi:ParB family chromosome partitioning protein